MCEPPYLPRRVVILPAGLLLLAARVVLAQELEPHAYSPLGGIILQLSCGSGNACRAT